MIQNIIFDFGDVFINLDKPATVARLTEKFGTFEISEEMQAKNDAYEMGLMSSAEFVAYYKEVFPKATEKDLLDAWNCILLDIPQNRIDFIKDLAASKKYKLYLLSNTNDIHIQHVINEISLEKFEEFKNCFDQFYLSYEINLRKPNADIFEFVLKDAHLTPKETLFIDDTAEHIATAHSLGIHTWNLIPGKDEVTNLFNQPYPFK
ncbi:HAD family hydrolase [Neptunitalea lumnitzerae]|uniref:Haloacid dehalogenase n=1 Tax=Neptunitalea lumnitzerae TaxID=2965509 RepID=A0ABQ5MK48_9FLAO|nr:HAD family phosphatase [Neptunitalea sp. Y10]GLB49758.1 haloacid dehalogenase [Neptunitalea sp. Y10]